MNKYAVKEIFYSLQGEGARAGSANVFVRFAGCNLQCNKTEHGFDCDTDFKHGDQMTAAQIIELCRRVSGQKQPNVILTGGEPTLQVDKYLITMMKQQSFYIAMETNGLKGMPLPRTGINWISCSPKTHEDYLQIQRVDEYRYVLNADSPLPAALNSAKHYYLSPAWDGDSIATGALEHCIQLVKDNPKWKLSVQQHKIWSVR